MSILIAEIRMAEHYSCVLLLMDTKEWSSYCCSGKMSTPIAQINTVAHRSLMLPRRDMKELCSYYKPGNLLDLLMLKLQVLRLQVLVLEEKGDGMCGRGACFFFREK